MAEMRASPLSARALRTAAAPASSTSGPMSESKMTCTGAGAARAARLTAGATGQSHRAARETAKTQATCRRSSMEEVGDTWTWRAVRRALPDRLRRSRPGGWNVNRPETYHARWVPSMPDDEEAVQARLERRLARERAARIETEAIAERGLKELYDKQRQVELLPGDCRRGQRGEARRSRSRTALDRISEYLRWPVGHAYLIPDAAGEGIGPISLWRCDDRARAEPFRRELEAAGLVRGRGPRRPRSRRGRDHLAT